MTSPSRCGRRKAEACNHCSRGDHCTMSTYLCCPFLVSCLVYLRFIVITLVGIAVLAAGPAIREAELEWSGCHGEEGFFRSATPHLPLPSAPASSALHQVQIASTVPTLSLCAGRVPSYAESVRATPTARAPSRFSGVAEPRGRFRAWCPGRQAGRSSFPWSLIAHPSLSIFVVG